MPHVERTGEYADTVNRSLRLLQGVIAAPDRASLHEMDEFAGLPWSHRWSIKGAGPLARLVWAAMGALLLTQSGEAAVSDLPSLFQTEEGPKAAAERTVWEQCATAVHWLCE